MGGREYVLDAQSGRILICVDALWWGILFCVLKSAVVSSIAWGDRMVKIVEDFGRGR